ncbi:alpha-galactosidase [Microbacteriaceae bacterium VKM Ac-2854]|nr:alpha-galactosidase [Microbacteriaceae bacterium VKM Ac-2854]
MTAERASVQWTLRTAATQYVVSLLADPEFGDALALDYWGPATDAPVAPWAEPARFVGYATRADAAPLEYASAGQRHVAFSELLLDRGDGRTGARWTVLADEVLSSAAGLAVPFVDETGSLRLTLRYAVSPQHDVVRRSVLLENLSTDTVELRRAFSAGWNVPVGQAARIDYLAGAWSYETNRRHVELEWGTFAIGSRQGVTSMTFAPTMTLTALPARDSFSRPAGDAYGVALDWSGSWRMQADSAPLGQSIRVSAGLDEDTTVITLLPGESFASPDALGVFSAAGADGVSAAWHAFQRTLARDLLLRHRPIVYNSWMATRFDVTVQHQTALAEAAAELGVEVFVVDDGWFVARNDDDAGLGDWTPDPAKFPNGLGELADRVLALGMRFGLWIEPECVNPQSELYRAHPDWIYRAEGRPLVSIRNQYVLDLGRPEVVDWICATFRRLLGSAPISYLKWDMNRPVTDGGRPGDPHGREWSLQHTRGYYAVLRMLRAEFPDVTIEACASGGARIDNAVLALSDVVWTSDQVGARDRLVIQDGFLRAYPAHVMSSWVSDDAGHRDRAAVSLGYRFAVAMAGVLGIGSDVLAWSAAEREEARERIAFYRDIREVLHHGVVATHGSPTGFLYCVEYAEPDGSVVLFVYDQDRDRSRDREAPRVFPTLLAPGIRYRLRGSDAEFSRESARTLGVPVGFAWAPDADVLVLDRA